MGILQGHFPADRLHQAGIVEELAGGFGTVAVKTPDDNDRIAGIGIPDSGDQSEILKRRMSRLALVIFRLVSSPTPSAIRRSFRRW